MTSIFKIKTLLYSQNKDTVDLEWVFKLIKKITPEAVVFFGSSNTETLTETPCFSLPNETPSPLNDKYTVAYFFSTRSSFLKQNKHGERCTFDLLNVYI